jgi:tetratricopeptide (TPR) repeat protein
LKSAFNALKQAQRINPDNEVVRGRMTSILRDLRKQMQAYYQEAILEESVGEVDSAKAKWKKIIETSVPEEEYFKKSTIKLKKYGTSID